MHRKIAPEEIDKHLPQTQCGLCTHGGCMPYAEAIVYDKAPLDLCPPGGVKTLEILGDLLQEDIEPLKAAMQAKTKPPLLARIREAECIGCTKCIAACPVDAIVGSAKAMHTVIADECTGCELCVAPCPVDCIDMVAIPQAEDKREQYRRRFAAHNARRKQAEQENKSKMMPATLAKRKSYIQEAIARAKQKRGG